jgi:hypothetical protein
MKVDHSRHLNSAIHTPVHWRMRAEEMRTIAEETAEPAVRAMMLRIAADLGSSALRPSSFGGRQAKPGSALTVPPNLRDA